MTEFYAGIGSRSTPADILIRMTNIAKSMSLRGWVLRSGAAEGADEAFEKGADPRMKEIYLPWIGFRGRGTGEGRGGSRGNNPRWLYLDPTPNAFRIAESALDRHHWHRLSESGRKLHARNAHQVLGLDLRTPSKMVICWTPGGRETGGTRTAMILAAQAGIPVINLCDPKAVVP